MAANEQKQSNYDIISGLVSEQIAHAKINNRQKQRTHTFLLFFRCVPNEKKNTNWWAREIKLKLIAFSGYQHQINISNFC